MNNKKNLDHWKDSHEDAENLWKVSGAYKSSYKPDVEKGLSRFKSRMNDTAEVTKVVPLKTSRRRWLDIAAAVILVLGFAFVWQQYMHETTAVEMAAAGETTEMLLADGTTVILNQNSRLEYPATFEGQEKRVVRLIGEAYFNVAHNANQPFTIETPKSTVTVLGTSFNLRAYPTENFTEVEVETGKVELKSQKDNSKILLVANEKGLLKHGQQPEKEEVISLNAQTWRSGKLVFKGMSLSSAVVLLERRFGVKIEISPAIKAYQLTNNIGKNSNIKDVFTAIEKAHGVKVTQRDGGTFVIK